MEDFHRLIPTANGKGNSKDKLQATAFDPKSVP
jgi:hypothetical protein